MSEKKDLRCLEDGNCGLVKNTDCNTKVTKIKNKYLMLGDSLKRLITTQILKKLKTKDQILLTLQILNKF